MAACGLDGCCNAWVCRPPSANLDFGLKKSKYFTTKAGIANFALTSSVLATSHWTEKTLKERQEDLLDQVASHWRLN